MRFRRVAAAAIVVVLGACGSSGSSGSSASSPETSTTLSLAGRTESIATTIRGDLCTGIHTATCTVDGLTPGVVKVQVSGLLATEEDLRKAGSDTGLWTAADAARMVSTRALDGTQRDASGAVSWTFHPDKGLQLVISVT